MSTPYRRSHAYCVVEHPGTDRETTVERGLSFTRAAAVVASYADDDDVKAGVMLEREDGTLTTEF